MSLDADTGLPPVLAPLKNIDTLLRCPICFDFVNISMMTKCSHNFCSLCIRKFLSYKLQCPVCNMEMTEQDLRNNRLVDDLVSSFQAARQQLSKAVFESPPKTPNAPAASVRCKTPRSQKSSSIFMSQYFQKNPKLSTPKESKQEAPVKEEPMEMEMPFIQMPVKQENVHMEDNPGHFSLPTKDVKPIIKVQCPVCSISVPQNFINKHLDMCLCSGEKKESLRSSLGKSRRPMPKLVYNLLSVQELKRQLKNCHLSVQGTRDQLIKRHQDFVHIYNSQCDSLNPKSAEDIAKEVGANEKIRIKLEGKNTPVMVISKKMSENEIDELHSNYRKQHSGDFSRLIAQVRGRLQVSGSAGTTATDDRLDSESISVTDSEDGAPEDQPHFFHPKSSSPTLSEVSISSSLSDIFGP